MASSSTCTLVYVPAVLNGFAHRLLFYIYLLVMGFFNGFLSHPTEVSLKQASLEYGLILVEGEFVEKAFKVAHDKFILTNKRLILICHTKNLKIEYLTIPYSSIRKFSKVSKSISDEDADLNIWLKDEMQPIRKEFKSCSGINDVYQILSKYTL